MVRPVWGDRGLERKNPPFALEDDHFVKIAEWLQQNEIMAGSNLAREAADAVAREHSFHPVKDYLNGLKRDGKPRLHTWLLDYMGAAPEIFEDDTPEEKSGARAYIEAVGEKWLTGAVARILEPACKNDCVPIFEGAQGTFKSSAMRALFEPWFSDDLSVIGSKDSQMQLAGVWCLEISELDAMSRGRTEEVKAFLSRQMDRFRPSYGRSVIEQGRQVVFAGTSNGEHYLRDDSGARRFWPVPSGKIRLGALKRDRNQLMAEAVSLYRASATWWMDTPELIAAAERYQDRRYDEDPWHGLVVRQVGAIAGLTGSVSIDQVLGEIVKKPQGQWTQTDKNRVARILKQLKWVRKKTGGRGQREWRYVKPC
jgi:predicted P-loop ATPase